MERSDIDEGIFTLWQKEVTERFYRDNLSAIPDFMTKLGDMSVRELMQSIDTYNDDRKLVASLKAHLVERNITDGSKHMTATVLLRV